MRQSCHGRRWKRNFATIFNFINRLRFYGYLTSRRAHAGTAGSLFASIFVVATLSMRTMIPLRVFGILTNIILIATAIPTHNYATLILHSVVAAAQRPTGCTRCCSWFAT